MLIALGVTGGDAPPQPPVTAATHSVTPVPVPTTTGARTKEDAAQRPKTPSTLPRSEPTRLRIPAIDLQTRNVVRLGLTPDGHLEAPEAWQAVGWYELGPTPGQPGPAVLAGHVDSDAGPAVFYRIGALRPGDTVKVARADEAVAVFTVYAVEKHPKTDFPTKKVYGDTGGRAELRLITCGGAFDEETQHYVSNIIVYAHMTDVRPGHGG